MHKRKAFVLAEVKAVGDETGNGEFEVILSMPTFDRDGEVIDAKAFDPLPDSIPFHAFHDFTDPVGRAIPRYEGEVLKATGSYASTPRAQEIRTLVAEGVIGHTSVGFMPPTREVKDGVVHITKGELLEGSFVSVPSNREAAVLVGKSYEHAIRKSDDDAKAVVGSWEERRDLIRDAVRLAHPEAWWTGIVATFDDSVVFEVDMMDGSEQFQAAYSITDGVVTLGASEPVEVTEVITPKHPASTNPEGKAAATAAADPPAEVSVGMARLAALRAEAELLLID